MNHAIASFLFHLWLSPPPLVVQEQVANHTRPGVDGVAQQLLGAWNRQFEVVASRFYSTWAVAKVDGVTATQLTGAGAAGVIYNGVHYGQTFSTYYLIDQVEEISCRRVVRAIGNGFNYGGGAELRLRFLLTPTQSF